MVGQLIVVEGADGSGKATQTKQLVEYLKNSGTAVETLSFPQYVNNQHGRLLQECLAGEHGDFMALDPYIAATLFAADRFESRDQISSWLAAGRTVVLDRYTASVQIHQGAKLTTDEDFVAFVTWVDQLEYSVYQLPRPDLTIYLAVPATLRADLLRQKGELDVAESDFDHQQATENRAEQLLKQLANWQRINCLDTNHKLRSVPEIHQDIVAAIAAHWS